MRGNELYAIVTRDEEKEYKLNIEYSIPRDCNDYSLATKTIIDSIKKQLDDMFINPDHKLAAEYMSILKHNPYRLKKEDIPSFLSNVDVYIQVVKSFTKKLLTVEEIDIKALFIPQSLVTDKKNIVFELFTHFYKCKRIKYFAVDDERLEKQVLDEIVFYSEFEDIDFIELDDTDNGFITDLIKLWVKLGGTIEDVIRCNWEDIDRTVERSQTLRFEICKFMLSLFTKHINGIVVKL